MKRLGKLEKQWDALWAQKHDEIAERLQAGGDDQRPEALTLKLAQSDASIEQLKRQREQMRAVIDNLTVADTRKNTDTLQASMLSQDLQHLRQQEQIVKSKLQQIEFELGQESYRITVEHHADVPLAPSNNKRLKYLAAAPLGVLGLIEVASVIRASDNSFRVEWVERRYVDDALASTERWSAILTIVVQTPTDADRLKKNPLGVYVHALNWSKELG